MREIKFRGKRIDSGEWVYGNLIVDNNGDCWIVGEMVEACEEYCNIEFWYKVDPATVGQYIDRKDIGGEEIYEDDVVKNPVHEIVGVVFWHDVRAMFAVDTSQQDSPVNCRYPLDDWSDYKVIGNIHDNPELLGVGE